MPQKRLASRTHKYQVFNLNKGLNLYARPQDLPEGYLLTAENVIPLSPQGLQHVKAPSAYGPYTTASCLDMMEYITSGGTAYLITRTAAGSFHSGSTAITYGASVAIPAASTHSMCVYRGKLVLCDMGSYPVTWEGANPGTQLTTAPKAGLCAEYKNRLWLGLDNTNTITAFTHTVPINAIGIPVSGYGLQAYPSSDADFGTQVVRKETAAHTFSLFNKGPGDVVITAISPSGLDFKITQMPSLPARIPPGGNVTFLASFTPQEKGLREGSITVTTDGHVADPGAAWTRSGTTVTVSAADASGWVADQWNNNYYWWDPDTMTKQCLITDNTDAATHTLVIDDATGVAASGSKWEIRHKSSIRFGLKGIGTLRSMMPSPPFFDFGQLIVQPSGGTAGLELTLTLSNTTNDVITITKPTTGTPTSGFTTTLTYYKTNDASAWTAWASHPATIDLSPGKSYAIKMKGVTTAAGDLVGSLSIARVGPVNKNRVYFSAINDETDWNPELDYFDMTELKGQAGDIMALVSYNDALWVPKESGAWVITGSGSSSFAKHEVPLLRGIGLCNPQAWSYGLGHLYGVGKTGVWKANGPTVEIISEAIRPTVEAWTNTHFSNMRLGFCRDTLFVSNAVSTWYYHAPTSGWTTSASLAVSSFAVRAGGSATPVMLFAEVSDGKIYTFGATTSATKVCTTWDHRTYQVATGYQSFGNVNSSKRLRRVLLDHSAVSEIVAAGGSIVSNQDIVSAKTATALTSNTQGTVQVEQWIFPPDTIGTVFKIIVTGVGSGGSVINSFTAQYNNRTEAVSR